MPKPRKWVFLTDNHGNLADRGAVKAAQAFCKEFKPDIRIHGGDCFDLAALRKGASDEERLEDLHEDIEAGLDFMRWFKPHFWLRGNHDERLLDGVNAHNPLLRRLSCLTWEEILNVVKGAQILPYCKREGILEIGSLRFAHGYASGIYATRAMAAAYENVLFGHVHTSAAFSVPGIKPKVGYSSGCLCKLNLPYNRAHLASLRQNHGFAWGFAHGNGTHEVNLATPVDGVWRFASNFIEVRA